MFEATNSAAPWPSPRALCIALLTHAAALALLLTVRFGSAAALVRPSEITLLAPRSSRAARLERAPRSPRVFRPLRAPSQPEIPNLAALELPPAPVTEAMPVPGPAPEIPQMDRARFRLKTDNFGETSAVRKPALLKPGPLNAAEPWAFEAVSAERVPGRAAAARVGGFSDGTSRAPPSTPPRAVSRASFGETTVSSLATTHLATRPKTSVPAASGVEILFKPRPVYADEARGLHIEGEVLLEVLFEASGEARVLRVVRGLGHGLDESAVAAAREIRFRSAVDATAIVHIVFQLAY